MYCTDDAITFKSDGILTALITDVIVYSEDKKFLAKAKWDTGSNCTGVTKSVVERLGLIPYGPATLTTANSSSQLAAYKISIILENGYAFTDVPVIGGLDDTPSFDVLIGMNIISKGDFAVSNFDGKTTFTFRIPSQEEVDFTKATAPCADRM